MLVTRPTNVSGVERLLWEETVPGRATSFVTVRPSTGGATPAMTATRTCTASLSVLTTLTLSASIVMSSGDQINIGNSPRLS